MIYRMGASAIVMKRTKRSGQTLIIALLILGVLLILGFVFLGLISRNITTANRARQRSVANDLAEAGIRYAHGQLLTNPLAADWRPQPTVPVGYDPVTYPAYPHFLGGVPRDPDYALLRPAPLPGDPGFGTDLGGPDGLGAYSRIEFEAGRALTRVHYGPSDANIFVQNPNGALRNPGQAKNFMIIEAVGKPGKINPNDPTTASDARGEKERAQSRKLIAFASIGLTEQAFFVTNKDRVSRAIEIGSPTESGLQFYDGNGSVPPDATVHIKTQFGGSQILPDLNGGTSGAAVPYGASMYFNGDVVVHGDVTANMNRYFGDSINVAGTIIGADNNAVLRVNGATVDIGTGNWIPMGGVMTNPAGTLDSQSSQYSTVSGMVRDGVPSADGAGNPRGARYKEPSSFLASDPVSHEGIYRQAARDSGVVGPVSNTGAFGYGRSVYVNNISDVQNRTDESGRMSVGTAESLVYDWLNPNNEQANSGWQGAFYVPRGAYVQLVPDGFIILRDSRAPASERTWRNPDGTDTGNSVNRYRIVRSGTGKLYIANSYTPFGGGVNINTATPAQVAASGQEFTGLLYFEGNVRVRGAIPTDVQLTLVSGGTIYVEGSITKGISRTQAAFDQTGALGERINTSSRSMLMLAAKDFVAVNTSQFTGMPPTQIIEEVNDLPNAIETNPIRMRRTQSADYPSSYTFRSEYLLNPDSGNPANPSTWKPYAYTYEEFSSSLPIGTGLMLMHTMDDGPASNTFISLDVNYGLTAPGREDWQYLFDLNRTPAVAPVNLFDPYQRNNASDFLPYSTAGFFENGYGAAQQGRGKIYGLGSESWQRFAKFETTFFPISQSNGVGAAYTTFPLIPTPAEHGTYQLLAQETNEFNIRFNDLGFNASNDYLIARAAMVPNDVRIEASMYAEDGSFFVIPGPWFNPNPNDRRDAYLQRVTAVGVAEAQAERYEDYGSGPMTPFYGEPIDVRVSILGSVSQNMPVPMSQQVEWQKKWGWIPRVIGDARTPGGANIQIPKQHVPVGYDLSSDLYVPNFVITYDPVLGSGRAWNPVNPSPFSPANPAVRSDDQGRMLAPMPRLPVSPSLAYFGEVNQ